MLSVFFLAMWVDIVGRGPGGATIAVVGVVVGAAIGLGMVRAALAALLVDSSGLTVRNPLRTVRIGWEEVASFEFVRYRILGCVLLIHRRDDRAVPVFGVEGITGQPRRKSSVTARAMADELNAQLAQMRTPIATSRAFLTRTLRGAPRAFR